MAMNLLQRADHVSNHAASQAISLALLGELEKMEDIKLTPEMVPVIKLARQKKVPYSWITGYYPGLNFGRIADVMKGRRYPDIPPAKTLPPDFPQA